MTHFIGAVVVPLAYANDVEDYLEKALDKFDENKEVPRYIESTKEKIIADSRARVEQIKENSYARFLKDPEEYAKSIFNPAHLEYLKNEFPEKLLWTDEQHYQSSIQYEEEENISEDGGLYSTYNPNSKWDWWDIGGRWKTQYQNRQGESVDELLSEIERVKKLRSDPAEMAKINDITQAIEKAREEEASWTFIDELEAKYLNCPAYMPWWFPRHIAFHDGKDFRWEESGKTGWFGMRSEKQTEDEWLDTLHKIVKDLPLGSTLYYIDFHI